MKIYFKEHNGEFCLSFLQKQEGRFLMKKLKAEGSTRESTLDFALNFYDKLTDKAAEILLATDLAR